MSPRIVSAFPWGSGGTAGAVTLAAPPPPPTGTIIFRSLWSTALGNSDAAVRDTSSPYGAPGWTWYAEFGGGALLDVVAAGPNATYPNALRVRQRGSVPGYAAFVQIENLANVGVDYYVRFYMRNDDTGSPGDHGANCAYDNYGNLTYVRKYNDGSNGSVAGSTWVWVTSHYTRPTETFQLSHMGYVSFSNATWYRFEYWVHMVDSTHYQLHTKVYNLAGTQLFGDTDMRQDAYGVDNITVNGVTRNDWTHDRLYTLVNYNWPIDATSPLQKFSMGNNGQSASVDTELFWYYAGVQLQTGDWVGP